MAKGSNVLIVTREKRWSKISSDRDVAIEKRGQVMGFLVGVVFALAGMLITALMVRFG